MANTNETDGMRFPQTVIVFGATGFIGTNLITRLVEKGIRLIAVSRAGKDVYGVPGISMAQLADVLVPQDSVVIHLAAERYDASSFHTSQSEILARNVELLGVIYNFCLKNDIKEIRLASSIAVYGEDVEICDDTISLDLSLDPNNSELMYGWSKRIGEVYARIYHEKYDLNTMVFRLSNPYGPFDSLDPQKSHVVPAFVMRGLLTAGPFEILENPEATRDFVYVGDVCRVFERSLMVTGVNDTYNIGSGINTSILALAHTITKLLGKRREITVCGCPNSCVLSRIIMTNKLSEKFELENSMSLVDGLKNTIDWYKNELGI
jgi:nucleoside-diphosphate-sugar epimerase